MSAGFGLRGGQSRCFTYWQDLQQCWQKADVPQDCKPQSDDYLECLHHKKELARVREIQSHFARQEHKRQMEQREKGELRATGGVLSLGLITDDESGSNGGSSPKEDKK